MTSKKILLVEGEADRSFYQELNKLWSISIDEVKVCTPRDTGHNKDSKEGVFMTLPLYLKQLPDESIKHLAVVVDADRKVDGGGYQRALQRLSDIVYNHGYSQNINIENASYFPIMMIYQILAHGLCPIMPMKAFC